MPNNNPSKLANLRMPDYSGSWWSILESNTTTMRIGKWTPVYLKDVVGNSLFKVKPSMRFESLPMVSPLYNGFTLRTKYYFAPYRLYIPKLRKNRQLAWSDVPTIDLPQLHVQRTFSSFNAESYGVIRYALAGSLLERLGMFYGECDTMQSLNNVEYYQPQGTGTFRNIAKSNMLPLLAYIDAWLYGEYNPQDKNIPVDTDTLNNYSGSRVYGSRFILYDNLRSFVDYFAFGDAPNWIGTTDAYTGSSSSVNRWNMNSTNSNSIYNLVPQYQLFTVGNGIYTQISSWWDSLQNTISAVGLLPVTYKGDYFTSWYNTEGINLLSNYVVNQGQTLLQLRKRNADFMVQLLALVSGNRWVDYLQFVFDTDLELKDHPIMVGFDEMDFGSIDVISNAQTGDGNTGTLGASASKARDYNHDVKPISFKSKEPGLFLVCSSIVPNVVYYQGFDRFAFKGTLSDLWHPQYQKMGFQEVMRGEQYSPFSAPNVITYEGKLAIPSEDSGGSSAVPLTPFVAYPLINNTSLGWVPLGWEYMRGYDKVSGGMRTTRYSTWSLLRRSDNYGGYERNGANYIATTFNPFEESGVDLMKSTYVDSSLYNNSFANVDRAEAENFVFKFSFDMSLYQPLAHQLLSKSL